MAGARQIGSRQPVQGLKNTLGSLKDELFADDDWDDWDGRGRSRDPWAEPSWTPGRSGWGADDWNRPAPQPRYEEPRYEEPRYVEPRYEEPSDEQERYSEIEPRRRSAAPRPAPFEGDPWAED